ncbi:uncharacterized protein N7482_001086 [Penicillium canariense]|uniref:Uncharacterized protein n=1 Tax=Penicillium canariense TaxID=189055 RepID=A0A9W9ICU2_9EURO|nr:uncharacterized protein N7482_001086 [Penicillium canariense]KAJ5175209.1 hypothetical protein N7482_001086 [Penicillium canariense]
MRSLLPTLSILLLTIFLILSLVFVVLSTTSSDWAHRDLRFTDSGNVVYYLRVHRSPLINCVALPPYEPPPPDDSKAETTPTTNAALSTPTDHFYVNCSFPRCTLELSDNPHLCQLLSNSAGLLITSNVLIGTTLLLSLVLVVLAVPVFPAWYGVRRRPAEKELLRDRRRRRHVWIEYLSLVTFTILLAGIVTAFLAQYLGFDGAVNEQMPNGNAITMTGASPDPTDPTNQADVVWVAGKANLWLCLGWGFAGFAAVGWGVVWGNGPRLDWRGVGSDEDCGTAVDEQAREPE